MVRSHSVMVWSEYLPTKSLVGGGGWVVSGRPNLMYSTGPGLWSLVLGPFGPDLGPDLDLAWDLDLSLTIFRVSFTPNIYSTHKSCYSCFITVKSVQVTSVQVIQACFILMEEPSVPDATPN